MKQCSNQNIHNEQHDINYYTYSLYIKFLQNGLLVEIYDSSAIENKLKSQKCFTEQLTSSQLVRDGTTLKAFGTFPDLYFAKICPTLYKNNSNTHKN